MGEFLLELLSEEIPARMQARAADDLKKLFTDDLKEIGIEFKKAQTFVTSRRLTLHVDGLPERQLDRREEKKGPRVGASEAAIAGFLKSMQLTSLDQCEKRQVGKAEFWFAIIEHKGRPIYEVLTDLVGDILTGFPWPKSMRAASDNIRWVRPLRNMLFLFDGKQIPYVRYLQDIGGLPYAELRSEPGTEAKPSQPGVPYIAGTNKTVGHRFLAPDAFSVTGFADYKTKLKMRNVVIDQNERRATIDIEIKRVAADLMLKLRDDPGLLDEVTGLVEWPVVLAGEIDQRFMDVPPEVLVTAMRAHQKYFALLKPDGSLAARFLVVANIDGDETLKATIVAGNERVLRARLSDAKFFWDQDRKHTLESRLPALATRIFYARLGTMRDKVERIRKLASEIAKHIGGADKMKVDLAARLCKADLVSGIVGEFPELQGVMGRHYALYERADPAVADAIRDHYAPLGPHDRCPSTPVSIAVALADKIDTLVGFFAIDEKPTGSKDPFALRRAALGVIRLILENGIRLPLTEILYVSANHYWEALIAPNNGTIPSILDFFADRLKVALREQGMRHDVISAVFAQSAHKTVQQEGFAGPVDLVHVVAKANALASFLRTDDGAALLAAYRRAANIVSIEEKRDGTTYAELPDTNLFVADEEKRLGRELQTVWEAAGSAVTQENYVEAMHVLSTLRGPVDAFFDKVTVNAPEANLRVNRLKMLASIVGILRQVSDFSRIEG